MEFIIGLIGLIILLIGTLGLVIMLGIFTFKISFVLGIIYTFIMMIGLGKAIIEIAENL
jgi:hypothetical protein